MLVGGSYAWENISLRAAVSEPVTLSLKKSAKNRDKNPNSLRSDSGFLSLTQIFTD